MPPHQPHYQQTPMHPPPMPPYHQVSFYYTCLYSPDSLLLSLSLINTPSPFIQPPTVRLLTPEAQQPSITLTIPTTISPVSTWAAIHFLDLLLPNLLLYRCLLRFRPASLVTCAQCGGRHLLAKQILISPTISFKHNRDLLIILTCTT